MTLENNSTPKVTIETEESGNGNLSWTQSNQTVNWGLNNGTFSPTIVNSNTSIDVKEFHLFFWNEPNSTTISIQNIDKSNPNNGKKVLAQGGPQASSIEVDFLGNNLYTTAKKGVVVLNFGDETYSASNSVLKRTLTVTNIKHLEGDLTVTDSDNHKNTYNATLQSMTGNLQFFGGTLASSSGTITFNGTGLKGNIAGIKPIGIISTSPLPDGTQGVTINFENSSTMTGDIKSYGDGNDALKKTIVFKKTSGVVLTGNVISYGSGSGETEDGNRVPFEVGSRDTGGHHITFEKGNMVGSIISTQGNGQSIRDSMAGATQRRGYNSITFSSGASQTLTGGILAIAYNNRDKSLQTPSNFNAQNVINLSENTSLTIEGNENQTITDAGSVVQVVSGANASSTETRDVTFTVEAGSITAKGYGTNTINLAQNSTLILNSIKTDNSGANPFDASGVGNNTGGSNQAKSIINFNGTGGTLQGNIITNAGVATINIANAKDGTITGNITKSGSGANNITYADTTGTLTLKGATNAISTLTTTQSAGTSTLNIDASANANTTEISRVTNNYLVVNFNSTQDNTATLSLTTTGAGLTIKDIDVTAGKNNILVLSDAHTLNISENVSIEANEGIAFDIRSGSNIDFKTGLTTADKGIATFELGGENTITGAITNSGTHNYNIHTNNTTLTEGTNTSLSFSTGENNINFVADNASFILKNNTSTAKDITSSSTANTSINFNATNGELSVGTATSDTATTTISVANAKSGTILGSITNTDSGATNIVLGSATGLLDAPTPTLTTLTLKGTSNAITLLTANDSNSKLSLMTNNADNTTTLGSVSGDNRLTVNFNGTTTVDGDKYTAKLTLNGASNKLKAITLGASSTNNTLEIASGNTRVNDNFSLTTGQEMSFDVKTNANLAFANGLLNSGGTLNLTSTGTQGQVSQTTVLGNITTTDGKTNLYFKDSLWAPASLSTREVTSSGVVTVNGGTSNIAVDLGGNSGEAQMPIYNVITRGGTNNILVKGPTHIGAKVIYGANGDTNLIFVSGSDDVVATLSAGANLTNPNDGISMFGKTFSNGVLLHLKDKNVNTTLTESGVISFLELAGKNSSTPAFSFTTQRNTSTNTDTVNLNGVAVGEIQAIGGTAIQDPSAPQTHTYNVVLNKDAVFAGKIALYGTNQVINLTMEDSSKLFVNNEALHIENLQLNSSKLDVSNILDNSFTQKNIVIDLATDGNDFANINRTKGEYRVLVIGSRTDAGAQPYTTPTGLSGNNGLFRVYVDVNSKGSLGGTVVGGGFDRANAYADRILVNNGTAGTHYIQAIYSEDTIIGDIAYHGGGVENGKNIAVATVAKSTNITFEGANQIQGFEVIGTELTDGGISTNAQGEKDDSGAYKTYFIGSTVSKGVSSSAIQTASSALGINYDLFLANFNSLNKRMGELRDNNNGQGAWARVFVGGLSTSYGLGTQSTYTTIQAGYDYAFGFEGANNYLGVALSYANALTDTKQAFDINGVVSGIDKTTTNGVEVALYNAYVEDSGWFNDTIFKFSYMMSDVKVINQSGTYSTNNFGIVLSDEFGYRFKLGESKEWYIDPQLEVGFGYFNQSDLKQVLGQATLDGIQDAIVTLRARVGANWAYDFKNFTQGKGINASVYLGTYYSYDYINGGEINLTTNSGTNTNLTPLSSTGRFEINVGTNIEVQNNTRIYFDFEKSFGGDITTDYQVNLGVRYSFGENAGYTPSNGDKKSITPLKVNDGNAKESEEAQEQTSEANKESANSQNNKTEESAEVKSEEKAQ